MATGWRRWSFPTKSPVVTALLKHAFPGGERVPSTRPIGCSESWVAYLARGVRQRRCREAPPLAAGVRHSLLVDAAGRLLMCGEGAPVGDNGASSIYPSPTPVVAMAGVRVQSVAAGWSHSLTCSCDGRVYSWGKNKRGQLGHGDRLTRPSPVLVEGLEGVCSIAAATDHCLAVTHSGAVFSWGSAYQDEAENQLRPSIVEGFEGVRVRRVCDSEIIYFAIGEAGELFSWGRGAVGILGHGDIKDQASPKRVEALRGVPIDSVVCGWQHALALAEDGLMYAWGAIQQGALLCSPHVGSELLPKPVLALPGVRMSSIAAASFRSYAVADSGEVWAWGRNRAGSTPLGHDEQQDCCPFPKPVESLPGVKVDAVAASRNHTLVLADDGSTYAWGNSDAQGSGALGLGLSVSGGQDPVPTPRHIRALRVACGL